MGRFDPINASGDAFQPALESLRPPTAQPLDPRGPSGVTSAPGPTSGFALSPDEPPTATVDGGVLVSASAVPPNAPRLMRPPLGAGSSPTASAGSPLSVDACAAASERSWLAKLTKLTDFERSPVPAASPA